ncbi:hypothetical protein BKH41_09440 [Helicobacter sp. 12S02232-10]|uniref:ArdC-like ssDNA-binding domain-containing protein n=1 Tax=Helicobacter sp. 12S02232-10 TaxID=1476197 RepID=UPI000BD7F417|nr:ArdC-like ssDNA-binding domain-containing protein [Helicobacter sp. 12S02232-10]PAF46199.1 hypothetical protein BKH41_09440 [Helicobacter sp. 12S02232-10]
MNEQEKKSWAEMSLEEKKDTFGNYIVYEVAMAMKGQYAPFLEKVETFNRAYNGLNGVPYNGLNSLVLDLKQKQGNYQSNVWLSLAEAKQLKVDEKEIDSIFQDNSIPKAKISFIKAFEYIPVYELDENGNKIPLLDKDGNQRLDKHTQEPLFRYVYEPQLDKDGNLKINLQTNQPYIQMKTEKVAIKPTLESKFLYNVDVFKTLDKNKMKPIKKEFLHKAILWNNKDFDHSKSHLIFGDIENKLHKATAEQIKGYLIAQNNDVAYEPPMKLNETQKQEVERIINEKLKENAPNIGQEKNQEDKKYKLTNESVEYKQTKLFRIEALRDFDDVKAGDKGGFVEDESNLSHNGNAWIYDSAIVLNGAKLSDNAKAYHKSVVGSETLIYGDVKITGGVEVYENKPIKNQKELNEYLKNVGQTEAQKPISPKIQSEVKAVTAKKAEVKKSQTKKMTKNSEMSM